MCVQYHPIHSYVIHIMFIDSFFIIIELVFITLTSISCLNPDVCVVDSYLVVLNKCLSYTYTLLLSPISDG